MTPRGGEAGAGHAVVAGIVAAVIGFAGAFTVVLAGLRAVGADPEQAASGLFVLCLGMGVCGVALSVRSRVPLSIAWSTPGAALLVSAGAPEGGWPAALGAFVVAGVLVVLTGLWGRALDWIAAIPPAISNAMLAGVLLPICVTPAHAVVEVPLLAVPVVAAWAVVARLARRWAVPAALAAAAVAVAIDGPAGGAAIPGVLPAVAFVAPVFDLQAILGIGLPLFVVTMASQNVPGVSVLRAYGYRPDLRPVLVATGGMTAATAPFGVHGVNLAAITAALVVGPDGHPDPARRWIAGASNGAAYFVLGPLAGVATAFVAAAPPVLVEAVAGLALLGALAAALAAAVADAARRDAAAVTLVVSASGVTALGVTAPFWGLVAGIAYLGLHGRLRAPAPSPARG